MRKTMFAVYDSKMEAYMAPFPCVKKAEAVRWFTELCMDERHHFAKFPEDYVLFEVGTWDEDSGQLASLDVARPIVRAAVIINQFKNREDA